jgi:hypothetical protein
MFLRLGVMLMPMTEPTPSSRLPQAVRSARLGKRWSKERAAREAGITSTTWKRVEDGLPVQEHNLTAIEEALGWSAGEAFRLKGDLDPVEPKPGPDKSELLRAAGLDPAAPPTYEALLEIVLQAREVLRFERPHQPEGEQ